ncbi:MAG TPA: YihY/virulence factor BrkB family protein [Terriglobia bacterium]|nr:YihY/virulence factor BrkB family protein [Terriglobia bacterium]
MCLSKRTGRPAQRKLPRWSRLFGSRGDLPFREWLKRVWRAVLADHCDDLAAQMAYFAVMTLFPFFIVLAAIIGYLPFTDIWNSVLILITNFFPERVQPGVIRIVTHLTTGRGGFLSFGLAGSIWIATRGVVSLMDGLNVAYNVRETRKFWKRRLLSCGVMLVFAFTFLTAFGLLTFGGWLGHWLARHTGLGIPFVVVWHIFRWAVSLTLLNLGVLFANHVLPNVKRPWRWLTPGSLFVVLAWFPSTMAFNAFVRHFAASASAYGTLGTFFVLMFWVYVTSLILLVGAEMDSELEKAAGDLPARDNTPRALIAS